ncbi:MAG TPA: transglycosylase SLT domain-containing protein [Thermoleophilaceae bacterium]|nr:transglycosylase SLT domain-containing protein [Thermoleophilaceae bacterium]
MSHLAAYTVPQRIALLLAGCAVAAAVILAGREGPGPETVTASGVEVVTRTPFEVADPGPDESRRLLERASDGFAHVLYELSPGGVEATAERTLRFRDEIRAAAALEGVDPRTLEALVFLESAGRPDVIAGPTPESAAGLTQIIPSTAEDLLGMSVDLDRSKELTRKIASQSARAEEAERPKARRKAARRVRELLAERRAADERFDPEAALAGAARYLSLAEDHFGREDLATVSYHMGIQNLDRVIATYLAPQRVRGPIRQAVAEEGLSYAQLYFDATPVRHPRTYALLRELGDDTRRYLFRLEAARDVLRLYRTDRAELRRLAELHAGKASSEEVLHPPGETERFGNPTQVRDAYDDRELVPLRDDPRRLGYRVDRRMGELARQLEQEPALYRGLRPEALATVVHIADELREITGRPTTLELTSTVRDEAYQELLRTVNPEAAEDYSLHTTGFAFDIARDLSKREEKALEAVLERLQAFNVLAWVYEPGAIHVTAGPDARELIADSGLL